MSLYGQALYGSALYELPPSPPIPAQQPSYLLTVNGVATTALAWTTNHQWDAIGQASFTFALPLATHIVDNATVDLQARTSDADAYRTIFLGTLRVEARDYDEGGAWGSFEAHGPLHLMDFPSNVDVAYAGGAGTNPALLVGLAGPVHLGNDTIGNYAETAPRGTKFDATWTPAVSSSFIRLTGRYHGANNDLQDITNPRITHYDRIEIRQGGKALGYGIYPEHRDEGVSYNTVETFGQVGGVWADFDITIAAKLIAGSTATARFISGYPPGGGRGDHEFQQVRRSTASQMTAREIVRGLFKKRGFGGATGFGYIVDEIVSKSGVIIRLGGNGFVDNGQTRIPAGGSWFAWIRSLANLLGYHAYDSPDGKARVRAIRGKPPDSATNDATFTEGVDVFRFRRSRDLTTVVNHWTVKGATGSDAEGTSFAYVSRPDPAAVPNSPYVPTAVGWSAREVSDDRLISDTLCLYVRHIREIDTQGGTTLYEWETYPRTFLQPGRVVTLNAPTIASTDRVWLVGVKHDWSDGGYWQTLTGWVGSGRTIPEAPDDPNPAAIDLIPYDIDGTGIKWRPYSPRSGT